MARRTTFAAIPVLMLAAIASLSLPLLEMKTTACAGSPQKSGPLRARFRVSLIGFKVNRETWDDELERDGKRDEVYVAAQSLVYGIDGRLLSDSGALRSRVMGDPTGRPERIAAGSTPANPGLFGIGVSDAGGLRTGDQFPASFVIPPVRARTDAPPMLLWEGELVSRWSPHSYDTNVALIVLTIWEWDSPGHDSGPVAAPVISSTNDVNYFLGRTRGGELPPDTALALPTSPCPCGDCVVKRCPPPKPPHHPSPERLPPVDFSALNVLDQDPWTVKLLKGGAGSDVHVGDTLSGDPRNRPIGMTDAGDHYEFKPLALVLPYAVASHGGVVDLHYRDDDRLKGDYTLVVRIERLP